MQNIKEEFRIQLQNGKELLATGRKEGFMAGLVIGAVLGLSFGLIILWISL